LPDSGRVRVEIGFDGGQALSLFVEREGVEQLTRALADGEAESVVLESEDGSYTLALRKIVYVKRFIRESKVGFGDV
jgi:hypothetical protein